MKLMKRLLPMITAAALLFGCAPQNPNTGQLPESPSDAEITEKSPDFTFTADPASLALTLKINGQELPISAGQNVHQVDQLKEEDGLMSWLWPDAQMETTISQKEDYLKINMKALTDQEQTFSWPYISGSEYYLPIGDGKKIPANDPVWSEHFNDYELVPLEAFSMSFWAVAEGDQALVYIIENPYNNIIHFDSEDGIQFRFEHEFPVITANREYSFRVYPCANDPVAIAKIYRQYMIETGNFKTLLEKAAENPGVTKLFGAPHIYFWNDRLISADDINWPQFISLVSSPAGQELIRQMALDSDDKSAAEALQKLPEQGYADQYQKNIICSVLSRLLKQNDFYQPDIFTKTNETINELLTKGIDHLNATELALLNKNLLYENMAGSFSQVSQWADDRTTNVLKELKESGLDHAWVGLDHWEDGLAKPEFVQAVYDMDYLIGTYDSYHSIHAPGQEQWQTAQFDDPQLYDQATVTDKNGDKLAGFQNTGRKLNPVLAYPFVEKRVSNILDTGILFNSWFIDCDATGEIYDDYTPEHITTQEEDLSARLKRIDYLSKDKKMVTGSEGGNDFAAAHLAFAHGIELQSFSWMDKDMKSNADSEYYMGRYYSPTGGVPERFKQPIPIKETYYNLFLNPRYQVPLYKLVYNDSMITTYHWDWSTLKMKDHQAQRMLYEVLYNVPPLWHMDQQVWAESGDIITAHSQFWSEFSKKVITMEMTDFAALTEDGTIQMTEYGGQIKVVANYGAEEYRYLDDTIPGNSLIIYDDANNSKVIYTPQT